MVGKEVWVMTKEEAISTLSEIRAEYNCYELLDERIRYHALSMGIEALEERKHGKWIDHQYDGLNKSILYAIECSACNDVFTEVDPTKKPIKYKFCPNCGADMRGDNDV